MNANRIPTVTVKERNFITAEVRRDQVRADFRMMLKGARDTAMLAALQRHLIALAAILDSLENDRCRFRSHERVAEQTARVRALRS